MNFQIQALPYVPFAEFFGKSDEELAQQNAVRMTVTENPGSPCRVSMADAEIGETVILLNYSHQPNSSPYKSNHAIFVRENVEQAMLDVNEIPEVIATRLISLRLFNIDHMMIDADVIEGRKLQIALFEAFDNPDVAYIHLHNAKPGCFAAEVVRAPQ